MTELPSISYDGRTPFTDIAAALGISEGAVRRCVRRLRESGLVQIVGVAEPQFLVWNTAAMIGVTAQAGQVDAVASTIARFSEVFCRDMEHFVQFLNQKLQQVPGVERIHAQSLNLLERVGIDHLSSIALYWPMVSAQDREPDCTATRMKHSHADAPPNADDVMERWKRHAELYAAGCSKYGGRNKEVLSTPAILKMLGYVAGKRVLSPGGTCVLDAPSLFFLRWGVGKGRGGAQAEKTANECGTSLIRLERRS
jgi:Lrp/AsnC family transcriptional regulator for asnA, asnC and gidA